MKILISGALGHMGRAVAAQAAADGIEILAGVDAASGDCAFPCYTDFDALPDYQDAVIIDFSRPEALTPLLAYATRNRLPVVLATTGYSPEQEQAVDRASECIPVFRSANMSVGVALLKRLCREAALVLGESFDVEIVEAHHNRKVDAPSGTALLLYDALKDAYEAPRQAQLGRGGRDCKRKHTEIGIHALRGGTVTGEHEVCFFGPAERIRLCHSAEDRSVFASGALKAAAYLQGKAPGRYAMENLVARES